jgi:uroporphyrin-III C-methyltransferase/precorrin-2 dehydrogenase/sirohydrochlorin ferrochelatase
MHSLPLFVRLHDRPVILLGTGETAAAKRRLLERAGARIVSEDAEAALAIIALDDDGDARSAAERLRARGILLNVVARPALCDFTLPAIVDRDPVLIAIGTGGASAGLAKAIRQRIEALLPTKLGRLARALAASRPAIRARWAEPADRRRAIDAALAPGGRLDPLADDPAQSVDRWISAPATDPGHRLVHVRLTSEDPDEMTLRTARLLGEADRIYHHATVPNAILNRARADAARVMIDSPPAHPGPGLSLWIESLSLNEDPAS